MRALFYIGDRKWTGCARTFVTAARGLAARRHQVTLVCSSGAPVLERIAGGGLETVIVDMDANMASGSWELRKVLQDRFIEVAFVHREREQLLAGSAMRLAERGAVIRRIPAFQAYQDDAGLALRVATGGLLFATEGQRDEAAAEGWPLPAAVAPLGVDAARYRDIVPLDRATLGVPDGATLIACPYEESGRFRLATVMRTLAILAPRHPDLHAVVYGPGALHEDLRMHAAALGVTAMVTFAGESVDELRMAAASDLVWVTADEDGGAYACLDAMALGRPVLAEITPLTAYYVADGATGVLLQPGEPSYVASAVADVLGHGERRAAIGAAGMARVAREFPESAMIDGFEQAGTAAGDRTRWAAQ
jgi:glycosyltransferase involved in cell wall biosynthesis